MNGIKSIRDLRSSLNTWVIIEVGNSLTPMLVERVSPKYCCFYAHHTLLLFSFIPMGTPVYYYFLIIFIWKRVYN